MENLDIRPTNNTPEVNFNAETGKLLFKGRSIPEDAGEFYERILNWLERYFKETDLVTELEFVLEYANSGSSKYILEMLKQVSNYTGGKKVKVIWCYEEDDESIEELGELYHNAIGNLPFEMREIPYEEEDL